MLYLSHESQLKWQFTSTRQELKLQGIKIRDGVVLPRYSWAKCFANDPSIFLAN